MRGFRFRLDSLRRVRDAELEARQAALERARQKHGADRDAAEVAHTRARIAEEALLRSLANGIGGDGLRAALEARVALGRVATGALEEAAASADAEQAARDDLAAAWRDSRSLDTLRARALTLWRGEQSRRQQREDDERAVRRAPKELLSALLMAGTLLFAAPLPVQAEEASSTAVAVPAHRSGELPEETLRRILGELRVREQALERRERDVAQRERVAEDLAADAKQVLAEMEALRAEIDERIGGSDAEGAARIGRLAKTYEAMPPAKAAPLLEDLDDELATAIVSKMKPKKSAAVLAQMSQETARRMSELAADPLSGPSADRSRRTE